MKTLLKINGKAAIVVPDNVLFEGGAGETVRRKLLQECDVHTILRTDQHFTLKTNTLKYDDLRDFIKCYNAENRHERKETDRFKAFAYNELMQRDKISLDIFWLKDESLEDSENLPDPAMIAREIAENLETALEQFGGIQEDLEKPVRLTPPIPEEIVENINKGK